MKKSELRQLIREEISRVLNETETSIPPMTNAQKAEYIQHMVKAYQRIANMGPKSKKLSNVREAIDNLPFASEHILACQLLGLDPDEHEFEDDFEMQSDLRDKGIDDDEFDKLVSTMYRQFLNMKTNDPEIKDIQKWYQSVN